MSIFWMSLGTTHLSHARRKCASIDELVWDVHRQFG